MTRPSKIAAWLDCAHFLTLRHLVEDKHLAEPKGVFGSWSQLLADKGVQHETDCLDEYQRQGKQIYRVPERLSTEKFEAWRTRIGDPLSDGHDVIYQMPLVHEGIRGIADFLIRIDHADGGFSYEPVDAKLARVDAKPAHLLQLCFYADALNALTGRRPHHLHLWLGSGHMETFVADSYLPYWNRIKHQLARALGDNSGLPTRPEPCNHCKYCEFDQNCTDHWRAEDSLIYVAGIRKDDRELLAAAGITSLADLSVSSGEVEGIRPERLSRIVDKRLCKRKLDKRAKHVPPSGSSNLRRILSGVAVFH